MSWLQDPSERPAGGGTNNNSLLRDFLNSTVFVESDFDTGAFAVDEADGHQWVVAYPSFALLTQLRGWSETANHAQLTGRQLRGKVPPDIGVMYRPNIDDEITIQWPKAAPVSRIAVQQ